MLPLMNLNVCRFSASIILYCASQPALPFVIDHYTVRRGRSAVLHASDFRSIVVSRTIAYYMERAHCARSARLLPYMYVAAVQANFACILNVQQAVVAEASNQLLRTYSR